MNRAIYKKIAKKHGVSVKDVKREMKIAVDEAHKNTGYTAGKAKNANETPTVNEALTDLINRAKQE